MRVLSATNRDLVSEVEAGRFREDLFYRINVVAIHLPALADRGRDILLLAQHFIDQHGLAPNGRSYEITPALAHKLVNYDWPGNVRELQNCIERIVILASGHRLTPADLPERILQHRSSDTVPRSTNPDELPTLGQLESRYIKRVLKVVRGNKTQAARILGMERRTLYRRLERLQDTN